MNFIIRKVERKDLDKLIVLCEAHALYEEASYDKVGKRIKLEKALFDTIPKLYCFVIEVENELVGYTSYTFDFSTWDAQTFLYMDCLYIESAYRSYGIGKVIFEKLKEIAIEHHCVNIQWQTPVSNKRAINFYNKLGAVSKEKSRFSFELVK